MNHTSAQTRIPLPRHHHSRARSPLSTASRMLGKRVNPPLWLMKACPHCGGDVYVDIGLDSYDVQCLQCSRSIPIKVAIRHRATALLKKAQTASLNGQRELVATRS